MKRLAVPLIAAGTFNAAAFAVDGNLVGAVGALVATVIITLATVRWIDERINYKIKNYAQVVKWQHRSILREISGIRELLGHPPLDVEGILQTEEREGAAK